MDDQDLFDENFFKSKRYRALIGATASIILIGTVFYHFFEGWRWIDSMYFSVITLTTVGYGDFSPKTDIGKVFTMGYVLIGIGLMFGFIDTFYTHRTKRKKIKKKKKTNP